MRNKQNILDEINEVADDYVELDSLQANTSKVSFWRAIKDVVAMAVLTIETMFYKDLETLKTLVKDTEPGTDDWYKNIAFKYQDGDNIIVKNNRTTYAIEDESKCIIKRISITDNPEGGFKMKVAKDNNGLLDSLTNEELVRFRVYMSRVKYVGVPIEIISSAANKFSISATIEIDSLLFNNQGKRITDNSVPIKDAINDYLQNFPFDEKLYLSKLIDTVQDVEGVKDFLITESKLDGEIFERKIDEVPSGYLILDEDNTNINYVLN